MRQVTTLGGIHMIEHPLDDSIYPNTQFLSWKATEPVRKLHTSLDSYAPTPLVELSTLANEYGVNAICIKDESKRFGLNAFKGLGGTYALFRTVCAHLALDEHTATLQTLLDTDLCEKVQQMTFVTATDGNHGKGIAWAAKLLKCKAMIYMPKDSAEVRAQAIRDAGDAEVTITDLGYDDTVRFAAQMAEKKGWFLVQDTSWPGYEKVPTWIIQGYTTMVYEALEQLRELGYQRPTHVFLQAGVGAMAGSVLGAFHSTFGKTLPVVSIVEPEEVACIFESARQEDGNPHKAAGSEVTIMAGLNCAEPCQLTWPILRDLSAAYFACPDWVTIKGMRMLASSHCSNQQVIAGESGAVTTGLFSLLMEKKDLLPFRNALGLNKDSVILMFNTEGDTNPQEYRKIISTE